jgi:hypothetical protein
MKIRKLLVNDVIDSALRKSIVGQTLLQLSDKARSLLPVLPVEIKPGLRGILVFLSRDYSLPYWTQGVILFLLVFANIREIFKIAFLTMPITLLFGWPWFVAGSWEHIHLAMNSFWLHTLAVIILLITASSYIFRGYLCGLSMA